MIAGDELFSGRLEKYGMHKKIIEPFHPWDRVDGQEPIMRKPPDGDSRPKIPGTTERSRFLTDGENVMSVDITANGFVSEITRYGDNDPNHILRAIDEEFDAELIREDESGYWGGTQRYAQTRYKNRVEKQQPR